VSVLRVYSPQDDGLRRFFDRRPTFDAGLVASVAETLRAVSERGAAAVLEHTRRFDAPGLESLLVEPSDGNYELSQTHKDAIRAAIERVTAFHEVQLETLTEGWTHVGSGWAWRTFSDDERETGMAGQRLISVASAGIYVPGGKADYPSSVVMNVVPAKVAGVERIVVATPPGEGGGVSPAVMFACRELGVDTVLNAGGASAIAAMALGIEGLDRVDVIAGPGNKYVNEAKRQLWGTVGLDSFAGPSEVCVFADDDANPAFAAADLIAQVEHAPDNVGLLVTLSRAKCDEIVAEVERQLLQAPRAGIVRQALMENGAAVVCPSIEGAVDVINRFAPEHLAMHIVGAEAILPSIKNAGAVMLGTWTAQSVGDYCEGPSHTLPTSGAARFASPVGVQTFLKLQSVSMLEEEDAKDLAPIAQAFAEMEGLPAHGHAASVRAQD
jgi:histidinol dehydrogenase